MKRPLDSSKLSFSAPRDESKLSSARLSEKTFNKKRFWLIVAILALIEAVILCLALQWKYIFPSREVSDLYTRYENVDGVAASFIKDYKVNDTVFVDVTLLEAQTDSAWTILQTDFDVPIIPEEYRELVASSNSVDFWLASKDNPKDRTDTIISHNDIIVMSRQMQTICICHIENKHQAIAIMNRETHDLKTSKKFRQ